MRSNIVIMAIIAVFFYLCSAVYTVWHMAYYEGAIEWVGTLALGLTGALATLIGFYLVLVYRGQGGEFAADRIDGELDDDDPEMGHYSPWSWWPLGVGSALALIFVSFTGPTFLIAIGGALLLVMMVGWVYEHYRGNFTR
ncbi:Cytochrome c oxidase subunit IV [Agrococcus baldri]|uniref:cytochrome-c oxidase n=1 Tax=Agrococcus baldri TaxID=153730 RepID=A0AA94HPG6_9MICO|nr:cytochrome c oxidase subunit 4 [Agrococcus baldri]SFS17704.1 Cytochrome c oxidase subunit IV [Agrococcus baldri]